MTHAGGVSSYAMKTLARIAMTLVLAAGVQAQTTITGKWQGTTRNGMKVVLDLKAADGVLTGTVTRAGDPSTITDGKVSGNTFTFKAVLGEENESLTGEAAEGQLKVWLDRQGRDGAVVFDRLKE